MSSIEPLGETSEEAGDEIDIDWEGIVDGTALPVDHATVTAPTATPRFGD